MLIARCVHACVTPATVKLYTGVLLRRQRWTITSCYNTVALLSTRSLAVDMDDV